MGMGTTKWEQHPHFITKWEWEQPNENSIHTSISKDCESLGKKQFKEKILSRSREKK